MEFGIYVPAEVEPIALVLEIIREGDKELSYLNRFCRNPQTKVLPPVLFPGTRDETVMVGSGILL